MSPSSVQIGCIFLPKAKNTPPYIMLEIRIESEVLELAPGTSVQITNSSPIFDKDSVDRKFTFPFRIPLTPNNRRIRHHSNRLDAGNKQTSRSAVVRFGGNQLLSGDMVQTSVSDAQEEVAIGTNPLKIWERLGKIKINEILETFNLLDGRPAPLWRFTMGFTGTYTFTIPGTTASATAATFPDIPAAGASIAAQLNAAHPGLANYNVGSNLLEVDSFFLKDNAFGFTLFSVHNSTLPVAQYRQNAVEAHILSANATPIASHCFPLIQWDNFYGDKNFLFTGLYGYHIINNVIDGVMLENRDITHPTELSWDNAIIPCVRIPYILSKIAETLGDYVWDGTVWDDPDFQKLIHVPNLALDELTEEIYGDLDIHKRNTFKPEIILNNMVPAMSAAEFITRLCNTFSLYLYPADGVLSFKKKQTPLQVKPINLDGRIGKNFSIEPNTVAGWKLAMATNPNEIHVDATELNSVVTGEGEYEILTSTSMFMVENNFNSPLITFRMPITDQAGRSPIFDTNANKSTMPLTLLFCHELQTDSGGDSYIFASHDGIDSNGDTVGAYSLSPEGEFGLYELWHKGVIEFILAASLKVTAYLHPGEVQKLTNWESGRIEFYHPEGKVTAAIKSVDVRATNQGLQPTQLELLYK